MITYITCFTATILLFYLYQKSGWNVQGRTVAQRVSFHVLGFLVTCMPLILVYGLRLNVGTDYGSYVNIYNWTKEIPIGQYIEDFRSGKQRIEIGYYIIGRIAYLISDNVYLMVIFTGAIMCGLVFGSIIKYNNISYPFAIFIWLMIQLAPAMNTVRSALAGCALLLSFYYIIENKPIKYLVCVLIAALFHKSAAICIVFWALKEFKSARLNKIRNMVFYIAVIASPIITKIGLQIAMKIPIFSSYFKAYSYRMHADAGSLLFLWRCLPTIVAVRLLIYLYKMDLGKYKVLLNIQLFRIPLLYFGNYLEFAGRMDRFASISEVILIPCVIRKIDNRRDRNLAYAGFAALFVFYFIAFYMIQGSGEIFPYRSVLGV